MPAYEYVLSTADGAVGIVTLNRPRQLNALAGPLMLELVDALEGHDADPAIRAIVVTGGATVFAAGADIKEMADSSAVDMLLRNNIALWDRVKRVSKPLIAAVAGYALGGGCELAMVCDIIVAAENARFGQPEINIGLIPGAGGTQRLTRSVGKFVATDMVLTGRMLNAEDALRHGLAARVVPQRSWWTRRCGSAKRSPRKRPSPFVWREKPLRGPSRGAWTMASSSSASCSTCCLRPRTRTKVCTRSSTNANPRTTVAEPCQTPARS